MQWPSTPLSRRAPVAGPALWGVLGGMGPRASAEFVKTIYDAARCKREQQSPALILYSDPSMPDRTEALLTGHEEVLVQRLDDALAWLLAAGATSIVISCITAHQFFPKFSRGVRQRLVSLLDLIFEEVMRTGQRHLLLCTEGTQRAGLFQAHRSWRETESRIVLLSNEDQKELHDLIYQIKLGGVADRHAALIGSLRAQYRVDSCIAGCTELHLLARAMTVRDSNGSTWVDPLYLLAHRIAAQCNGTEDLSVCCGRR